MEGAWQSPPPAQSGGSHLANGLVTVERESVEDLYLHLHRLTAGVYLDLCLTGEITR